MVDSPTTEHCEWKLDDPDQNMWHSDCDNDFTIMVGTPAENEMRFCCYCGRPVKEQIL